MKKNIALITGGTSSEYVVSLNSAVNVAAALDSSKYNVYQVVISRDGWLVQGAGVCDLVLDKNDFSFKLNGQKTNFDAAFIVLHGSPGEDGLLQGYLQMLGIPFTTGNALSMSLSFSKNTCNNYLRPLGVPMAKSKMLRKGQAYNAEAITAELGLPCFVKPNNAGSSFGVSKVKHANELEAALNKAFKEDKEVLVESFLNGRELTCGIFKSDEHRLVMPVTEIVSKNEFFDYQAKYTPEFVSEITPAQIPDSLRNEVQAITEQVYDALNCHGIARADFIAVGDQPYFLEINTVPGMTSASLVPQQIREMGLSQTQVFDWVLDDAFKRAQQK